ncbi:MAG: thioether cross-link-forming SCIFF peptide maturase [Selenomonadaceae bacterium]|nr:thioether cross-link-forming SCIFF peptide maturase [Selenomonadaceae bacterium]
MEDFFMIHKFKMGNDFILLDVESGAVHIIDKIIFDILDIFDGKNDSEVLNALEKKYNPAEISEALGELHELIDAEELFAPEINIPQTFQNFGVVKSLCFMVAQDCNLRCKYCFGDGGSFGGERAVMSEEVGRAAVDFIIKNSGIRKHCEIDFFGGEPLLNFKTVKAVTEYVREREKETGKIFKLTLTTNGILLDEKKISWLNENNISLVLSLDGRKKIHDEMRPDISGKGSYDRVIKNFKNLVESRNGENYYLRGTYTNKNLDFSADVLSMADEGFDILSVEPVVLKNSSLALTEKDLPKIFSEYDKLTEIYLQRRKEGKGFFFFHFNVDLNNGPCVAKRLAGCGAGHEYFAVAENGDLYPCHQFVGREKYKLGNIFSGVDENSKHWTKYFRESHVLNKPKCKNCWAKFFCSGGCHANADLFHGDIREPYEIGCEIQKKRLECAIYIQAVLQNENPCD